MRRKHRMKAEAEMGVMCQEAKEPQGSATRSWERGLEQILPHSLTADTLISDFSLQN